MFAVNYDKDNNCLNVVVKGFWKPEDVALLASEVGSKANAARGIRQDFDACVESLEFPVQAMDVANLLTAIMQGAMALTTGRAAVVVGSQLNKLQAERTLVHERVRMFLSSGEAREWLAAPAD
ncbi:hypothetical protein EAH84_06595 [Sphingomonas oligophenolica]|uniref:STAS/SEC14 domain-containing protein n=2 Tax=Sphingomonas oligophenolica TaxID=301154 RepID=A0A502CJH8_9SPHN|nr:hypothetical protein EAH84_06595 [Sphingomonas oligophenolica]